MRRFIDLFAGCGGFSSGLRAAGWKSVAKVEIDNWACETLRTNFPESQILESDIRAIRDEEILNFGPVDLIVGGPPCQGFSVAGATQFGIDDPRNELFRWFLRWVQLLRPKAAVIENVPHILSRQNGGRTVLGAIEDALRPFGYSIRSKILDSADFGVPQARRRAFIVMMRGGKDFEFPLATHGAASSQNELFGGLSPLTTVGEALSDLPQISAGEGQDSAVFYATGPMNDYQRRCRAGQEKVSNHIAMKHTPRLIERFKMIDPGKSLKDVPLSHGQIAKITGNVVKNPFKYNNYRLDPAKPSLAIPASFQSLFLHPSLHRNLTAREAARLMGFPDSFVFMGKRTTMSWEKNLSQYNQIGNAVCPPVAEAIGKAILSQISGHADGEAPVLETGSIIVMDRHRLRPAMALPSLHSSLAESAVQELNSLALQMGEGRDVFRFRGMDIPSATLPLALILAGAARCPVCSPDCEPMAQHGGEICFLISKDGVDSLVENEQDHGLDYHLRAVLGIDRQVGHFVGARLAELGFADLVSLQNPRTGRNVRGMRVLRRGPIDVDASRRILRAIERCSEPEKSRIATCR